MHYSRVVFFAVDYSTLLPESEHGDTYFMPKHNTHTHTQYWYL